MPNQPHFVIIKGKKSALKFTLQDWLLIPPMDRFGLVREKRVTFYRSGKIMRTPAALASIEEFQLKEMEDGLRTILCENSHVSG